MAEMTPGTALRQLKQAHATLKKARQAMRMARENPAFGPRVLDAGWDALMQAHRLMAEIPRSAVDEEVLTQQLSVQRYATALLVRLRRILRKGEVGADDLDDLDGDDE
ncbi:hypothetical protein [Paludisphaera soli]|jgi:hypothetical protein|uniref:hypothetical protein n=1 Tax=Paludisphaera soli TaxID=2712865 RepID=UPI0013EB560E|nr:hypothetical protein [Paludisphaera soli]